MSARGKCGHCGTSRLHYNIVGLHSHNGEAFDHWRKRSLAALGVVIDTDDR